MSSDEDGIALATIPSSVAVRLPPSARRYPPPPLARKPPANADADHETDKLMGVQGVDDLPPPYPITPHVNGKHNGGNGVLCPLSVPTVVKALPAPGITDVGVSLAPSAPLIGVCNDRPATAHKADASPNDDNDDTDDEVLNVLGDHPFDKDRELIVPNKAQVLLYFATATNFKLRRTGGGELQVTDACDYPLFDVWIELDCCRCTWVLEAYGKTVLLMHEKTGSPRCLRRRRGPGGPQTRRGPPISITDWNGDLFGYLTPGDPFLLQSGEKTTVAKLQPHTAETTTVDGLAAGTAVESGAATGECGSPSKQRLCWMCVLEGTGRHIARFEGFDDILFNKDVAFQLKLLTLAGIIRLSAPWNMPGRGEGRAAPGGCWRVVSSLLNCCAYCLY